MITGALDFIIEPIRPLFDDIVCAEMEARDGRLTGHLTTLPPIGEARALLLAEYAERHSLSLEESVAYADSASDLAMLEAVGFPVAVNPEARLSAIARRRGWHVEHWAKAEGGSHRPLPLGPFDVQAAQGGHGSVSTLLFERSLPRFAAARVVSSFGSGRGAGVGPLRLVERDAPDVPAEGWAHVDPVLSGICGSDLATLDGRSSRYFEGIVSFPFVPGHEVVGTLADDAAGADGVPLAAGTRVVLQPVLGCAARGIKPPCPACQAGKVGNCGYLAFGHIRPGLQTGFCADTGGGWSSTGPRRARQPALRGAREPERRRRRDGRARGLRGARRTRRAHRRGRRGGRARRRHAGFAGHGGAEPPRGCGSLPAAVGASWSGRATPHQQRLARELGLHRGAAARPTGPCRAPALAFALVRRRVRR